jgi:hypothetical protein
MEAILRVPDADLWQLHRALDTDSAHNTSEPLTANVTDSSDCKGYWIKATVWPDGERFTINNARNGESRTYLTR